LQERQQGTRLAELAAQLRMHAHSQQHGGHDVQQRRLGGLEDVHDRDGGPQAADVPPECTAAARARASSVSLAPGQ